MLRVYFGHHKCASQYIKAVFLRAAALLGMSPRRVDNFAAELPLDYHTREPYVTMLAEHRARLLNDPAVTLCLTNGDNEAVALLEQRGDYRGFHVIRDPRDVLVSAYFSHRYSHPIRSDGEWIAEFRRQLRAAPDVEGGLLLELEFNAPIFAAMGAWDYTNPGVYETRYETLIADPVTEFRRIFNFLGIATPRLGLTTLPGLLFDLARKRRAGRPMPQRTTLPIPLLQFMVERNDFTHQAGGRQPGEEDAHHHYRKGVAGDWRNHFTPRVADAFKQRYGDLLIALDYERGRDW
jgi:hypothetical protein